MKKTFLVLLVAFGIIFAWQVVLADNAVLFLSPASSANNVGASFNVAAQINPSGNNVCVVEGTLVFNNLTCQNISVASGLMAQTSPTCSSPNFVLGIPKCTTAAQNILSVAVSGNSAGNAGLSFSGVKIIGVGAIIASNTAGGTYTINSLTQQTKKTTQKTITTKPSTNSEQATQPETTTVASTTQTQPTQTPAQTASISTMSKIFASPITVIILVIIIIALSGMWAFEKFFKKSKA